MRKSWNRYFTDLASSVAARSTYDRILVGYVLANSDDRIVSTDYNGAISDNPHCDGVGRTLRNGHYIATIHAEVNALLYYAEEGIAVEGCIHYMTRFPCLNYTKSLIQVGISKIYYHEVYRVDKYAIELLDRSNIGYVQI